jgi:hypothetical protein
MRATGPCGAAHLNLAGASIALAMKFRYRLPDHLVSTASTFEEFANGSAQASVRLRDGRVFGSVLISNSTYLVAARGFKDLPFKVEEIETIFQADEDIDPKDRGGWDFWDDWKA